MLDTTVYRWDAWPALAPSWTRLATESDASLFVGPAWVASWLEAFGEQLHPRILVFRDAHEVVGACVLVSRLAWRKFLPMRRWHLNCAGEDEIDDTAVEYNRLLSLPGRERDVADALVSWLGRAKWDEVLLDAVETPPFAIEHTVETVTSRPCYFIDLEALRSSGVTYDSVLSANTRQQIRRSVRLYEDECGPLALSRAGSLPEAAAFLDELAHLHQRAWTGRGKPGVFASHRFQRFHARLIGRLFDAGHIELLKVTAGDTTVGVLYSFLHDGRLCFYQSGFAYQADNRAKPGLMTHYLAVTHYLAERPEVRQYDFLAGDSQYKRSLAREQRRLQWIVLQRSTLRVRLFNALRARRRPVEPTAGITTPSAS